MKSLSGSGPNAIPATALSGSAKPPPLPRASLESRSLLGRQLDSANHRPMLKPDSHNTAGKILIIDDEVHFQHVIAKFLAKKGFEAVVASDGKTGLALAATAGPDLVVCDLNMPGMDGYEVLAAMRRDPALVDIPLIFMTAQSDPCQVRQGMNLGADDYLTKPANLDDLLSAINVRLNRRQEQRQRQEKQLERAMQLFAGIVHDLRDPLFVVLGYTNLLQGKHGGTGGNLPPPSQILDRMHQAILGMQAIVSETLFLARSRMQKLPFDPAPLDLQEFCEQLVASHEQAPRLQFQSTAGPFPISADALRLHQAMENLVSNALKYSDGPVRLSLTANPEHYLIEVKDQGIGIPAEEQAEVFEPFYRASNTGDRPGHGLGLSVVKSCIAQHGGSVRFQSSGNEGTAFFIELPKSSPAKTESPPRADEPAAQTGAGSLSSPAAAKGAAASPAHAGIFRTAVAAHETPWAEAKTSSGFAEQPSRLRGIIVDDDALVRDLLRDLLDRSSDILVVGEAGTVAQARKLVKQQKPQVVFLDVNLPDASGFDLLPDLERGTSVVFVTSAEEHAVHAFDCEAADYLLKPVSPERLQRAVARVRQNAGALPTPSPGHQQKDSFLVKTLTERRLVKLNEIERIIAYGEYSWVYCQKNKKGTLLRKSLKQWLAELPGRQFLRVHRRAIVNLACMDRVERLSGGRVQIHLRDNPEPVLVSLRLAPSLNRRLAQI
jgi:two-component system, sensor histidine kinase and response regulator